MIYMDMLILMLVICLVMFVFVLASVFLWFISGKQWLFYLKAKLGRKKNMVLLQRFRPGKLMEQMIVKYPEDIKFDQDSIFIGAEVQKPQFFDAMTGLPVIYVFDGALSTTDFRDLIYTNETLKRAFQQYPSLMAEMEKIETTDKDGKKGNLLKFALTIDPSKKMPETKLEDIVNFQVVRAYNLGLLKGRQENKALGGMSPFMIILLFVIIIAVGVAIYYGYTNHKDILSIADAVAKIPIPNTIIPGK